MTEEKICSFMGLAVKAGKTASGSFSSDKAIKTGRAALVLVASDASENTKKGFRDAGKYYETSIVEIATKAMLGKYCGKKDCTSVAILNESFAKKLKEMIDELDQKRGGADIE
ncbi:MAG: ribosomal L7Ae/L30e/S12e/Gadd45 family protein [Bacillota bacterium]